MFGEPEGFLWYEFIVRRESGLEAQGGSSAGLKAGFCRQPGVSVFEQGNDMFGIVLLGLPAKRERDCVAGFLCL